VQGHAYNKSMYDRVHTAFARPILMADAGMAFQIRNYTRYIWNKFPSQRDAAVREKQAVTARGPHLFVRRLSVKAD
jgi:hypothetical protein